LRVDVARDNDFEDAVDVVFGKTMLPCTRDHVVPIPLIRRETVIDRRSLGDVDVSAKLLASNGESDVSPIVAWPLSPVERLEFLFGHFKHDAEDNIGRYARKQGIALARPVFTPFVKFQDMLRKLCHTHGAA
jgi:hypothetical protein